MLTLGDKTVSLNRKSHKVALKMQYTPHLKEIENIMKFDKVQPIHLTPSDEQDMNDKGEGLRNWYEEKIKKFFS